MSATLAARAALATALAHPAGPFTFALASDDDDRDIRRLLRDNPLPGELSLSFEREPRACLASLIEGDVHQTLVARRRATGEIAGLAARSVRTLFVNGRPTRVGYLGQLRVASNQRYVRALLDDGFAYCRALHHAGDAPAYLVSLIAENDAARRLLVERRSPTAPRFVPIGELETFAIPTHRLVRGRGAAQICEGSPALVGQIAACLQRNLRRYQFAPSWEAADFDTHPASRPGPSPEDFAIATDEGRVVGCAALWDQRAFKQVVVRGYSRTLRRARPFINVAAACLRLPRLPAVGQQLQFGYLSHIAVDTDREDVLRALLSAHVERARRRGLDYVVAGFADQHPFQAVVRPWAHRTYRSAMYVASWPDGDSFVHALDGRPAQPEVAVL